MSIRNDNPVGVLDDVAAAVEVIDTVVRLDFVPVADGLAAAFDAPRLALLVDRTEREVDAVRLYLRFSQVAESIGDEPPTFEHTRFCASVVERTAGLADRCPDLLTRF